MYRDVYRCEFPKTWISNAVDQPDQWNRKYYAEDRRERVRVFTASTHPVTAICFFEKLDHKHKEC